jgi:hypothetical protein
MGTTSSASWHLLRQHRELAARYPLNILIWGPGKDKSVEYRTRVRLRQVLLEMGHNAQFSEDLCDEPGALNDPLNDERLQAEAAHVIVMLYGSRGTQTERDVILTEREIACKAIVLVEKNMYQQLLPNSVAGKSWEEMGRTAKIIPFSKRDLPKGVVADVCKLTEEIRCACYVRDLRRRNLNGN